VSTADGVIRPNPLTPGPQQTKRNRFKSSGAPFRALKGEILMADDKERNRGQMGQQNEQSGQQGRQSDQHGQNQTGGQQGGQTGQKKGGQGTEEDDNESLNRQRRAS
jgi:hypothetical protein